MKIKQTEDYSGGPLIIIRPMGKGICPGHPLPSLARGRNDSRAGGCNGERALLGGWVGGMAILTQVLDNSTN
jgi:hypothetical protein